MTWRPLTDDTGSSSAQQKEYDQQVWQQKMLVNLESICSALDLLNARLEENFETGIEDYDV